MKPFVFSRKLFHGSEKTVRGTCLVYFIATELSVVLFSLIALCLDGVGWLLCFPAIIDMIPLMEFTAAIHKIKDRPWMLEFRPLHHKKFLHSLFKSQYSYWFLGMFLLGLSVNCANMYNETVALVFSLVIVGLLAVYPALFLFVVLRAWKKAARTRGADAAPGSPRPPEGPVAASSSSTSFLEDANLEDAVDSSYVSFLEDARPVAPLPPQSTILTQNAMEAIPE
eukprot:gnl/Chilomastix_cuspidata/3706.p1 GENE.gnl/Chilomastix_cuspidata/3706~~gnl/Chilomastix_cuspidata/3706.p1  ORF type:complete len:225 (-),score=62.32 gnl/Chilomastix_cuspidata/3706:32-706(-)